MHTEARVKQTQLVAPDPSTHQWSYFLKYFFIYKYIKIIFFIFNNIVLK
jgi:hypothetical protein